MQRLQAYTFELLNRRVPMRRPCAAPAARAAPHTDAEETDPSVPQATRSQARGARPGPRQGTRRSAAAFRRGRCSSAHARHRRPVRPTGACPAHLRQRRGAFFDRPRSGVPPRRRDPRRLRSRARLAHVPEPDRVVGESQGRRCGGIRVDAGDLLAVARQCGQLQAVAVRCHRCGDDVAVVDVERDDAVTDA